MSDSSRSLAPDEADIFQALDAGPTMARYLRALSRLEELDQAAPDRYRQLKTLVVRNFTIEPIEPYLRVAGYRAGLSLQVRYTGYDPLVSAAHDIAEDPDVVFVALRIEELAPGLVDGLGPTPHAQDRDIVAEVINAMSGLLKTIRTRTTATLIVHNFVTPLRPAGGLADSQVATGQLNANRELNVALTEVATQVAGTHILDLDHLFARLGLETCFDERGQRLSDAPYTQAALRALADSQVRHLRASRGTALKCVVVDCDNTLWGGTVGEDGVAGLLLSRTGPGRRFWDLQAALRRLRNRGVVLAIASKNEPADVLEVLRSHPECVLGEADFAAMRINWEDKADNIRAIAEELNLGLADIAFLDDNPVECEWIRTALPAVRVLEWPDDLGAGTLDDMAIFDTLVITEEDRRRTEMYRAERSRAEVRSATASVDDYLRSLEMVATVGSAEPVHVGRLAQLTQRTNQFNLRTRRYDPADLADVLASPDAKVVWLELTDRFGEHGMVGCGIVRVDGEAALIDTLLLSCRVLGRRVEDLLACKLVEKGQELGAQVVIGEYVPSERNGQVADFYGRLGFSGPKPHGAGVQWFWNSSSGLPDVPDWFKTVDLTGSAG